KNSSGQILIDRVENITPYALLGDDPRGDYNPWMPEAGDYVLEVTAFSDKRAGGIAGPSQTFPFTILDNATPANALSLYPNPTGAEQVHLDFEFTPTQVMELKVRDQQGRIILQKQVSDSAIDLNLSQMNRGFYIVEINTGKEIIRKTLIKY
ncbi:MAG: T9SS type A sorting domain-containing protein, partial [Bacteroidota bacterium]